MNAYKEAHLSSIDKKDLETLILIKGSISKAVEAYMSDEQPSNELAQRLLDQITKDRVPVPTLTTLGKLEDGHDGVERGIAKISLELQAHGLQSHTSDIFKHLSNLERNYRDELSHNKKLLDEGTLGDGQREALVFENKVAALLVNDLYVWATIEAERAIANAALEAIDETKPASVKLDVVLQGMKTRQQEVEVGQSKKAPLALLLATEIAREEAENRRRSADEQRAQIRSTIQRNRAYGRS